MTISRRLLKRMKKAAAQAELNSKAAHIILVNERLNISPTVDTNVNGLAINVVAGTGQPKQKAKPKARTKAQPKMHYTTFVRNYL